MKALQATANRREKALAKQAGEAEQLFQQRYKDAGKKSCCMPLAAILRALGYSLSRVHPYGQKATREALLEALNILKLEGVWQIDVRDLQKHETPIGLPEGDRADAVWVYFHKKATPTGYTDDPFTSKERYLNTELMQSRGQVQLMEKETAILLHQRDLARAEAEEWKSRYMDLQETL